MRRILLALAALLPLAAGHAAAMGAHDFAFTAIEGGPLPLSAYRGKAVLVVNTASMCGYTPQYQGLQALWEEYRDRGLVVLGVPSNDFGGQEPGSAMEIKKFCEVNFAVDFPMTTKEPVSGPSAHPFYLWAAAEKGAPKWNFHKYLLDAGGRLVAAFPSKVEPAAPELRQAVEAALPR
ncbi:MAG TPA: glutathione peroxidase [Azospirillaceae bacterium]|nr:glutathione peroxidase [Azospirillaceae bacterium]